MAYIDQYYFIML